MTSRAVCYSLIVNCRRVARGSRDCSRAFVSSAHAQTTGCLFNKSNQPAWHSVSSITSRGYCTNQEYGGNYYLMLDIRMDATPEEIKTAYYRLSKRYHPDINKSKGATEKFARITDAYHVLSSEGSRETYDQWLKTGLGGYSPKRNYPEPGEEKIGDKFGNFGSFYRRGR